MNKVLSPVLDKPAYAAAIEPELVAWLREVVFGPIFDELATAGMGLDPKRQAVRYDETGKRKLDRDLRLNAERPDALVAAIRSGRVWYADGAFGSDRPFGADVTRELRSIGATFDQATRLYVIAATDIPFEIKGLIGQAQASAEAVHRTVIETLTSAGENVLAAPTGIDVEAPVARILADLNKQFQGSIPRGLESITVSPELQPAVRAAITKTLTENLDLSIKRFAAEEIPELRRMVEANLMAGARLDRLSRMIEARWGVAKRKAEFLASQETSLLTAKFRMERAKNAGSVRYIWHTRRDSRVRHDHAELEGKTFFWDQPPLVDAKRNRHANPGEDYGCRCWSQPIIEIPYQKEAA